ncbi:hypothetical protein SUGI_0040590 [Cryptomeria japonica]|uniref:cytosolic sulfotransferase 18-like n=1 Tax=Cryptomeria japonica TaxID=3369 RepID=UPI002408B505|nr:cytosolic sulfotransferase 18-like [Cryptomeria japonica]GLJ06508.1 hypothetical protein SUGI_0040590 [Cryptomeria japonica]
MSAAFAPCGGRRESHFGIELVEHDGFFYGPSTLEGMVNMYSQFKGREDDVLVCSAMKTGTTCLKAIITSIMSESKTHTSKGMAVHDLIPSFEVMYSPRAMHKVEMPSPKFLSTHLSYSALPPQIISLGCRIIYIVRNPKETFVSHWKFLPALQAAINVKTTCAVSKEAFFGSFCNGVSIFGPFVDHVLGFWNASRNQSNILFLTYEDMKAYSLSHIKKIADFLGQSCLAEEDIRYIDSQCNFQFLSTLDVNRNGTMNLKDAHLSDRSLFRKGEVGDWKNHFIPEMNRRMDLEVENKFQEAGMFLKYEL